MATKVHMEALSPTMEEGQLVRWLKAEGDPVSNGDVLAEIETDKATMELVARGDGVLRRIFLEEGGTAPVGDVIAVIAGADEDVGDLGVKPSATEPKDSSTSAGEPETETPGDGPEEGGERANAAPGRGRTEREGSEEATEDSGKFAEEEPEDSGEGARVKASPLARRLAEEARLQLSGIEGTGPGGRIVKRDVEAARDARGEAGTEDVDRPAGPGTGREKPDFEDVPLSQMRKTIARRLVESIGPVPHFFLRISVDMSRILEARERVNRFLKDGDDKISINDFILKATATALARHPEVNSHWNTSSIRRHGRVHLGVAVATDEGLITPVIRDADGKSLVQISREVRELAARGRERRLQPEEYTGSTFSLSNLGMFGIHEFTGVINPPEAGILAVGGIEEIPVASDGQVVVRPLMTVTMSCDHRVIDGATGAKFLQTLREMLEEPATALL